MCEFCTKHGDGKIWYKNASNYSQDLLSDLNRRRYIGSFFEETIQNGFETLGRLETIVRKKGRLPEQVKRAMAERAKAEHFGQVLPLEEIRDLVMRSATIVRMPCACRWAADKKELRCCYGISFGPDPWYKGCDMSYFGTSPDAGLEALSREEAVGQMEELEAYGAIHTIWTLMTPFIGSICNCSLRDCLAMRTLTGIGVETMARAEYVAQLDEGRCSGCGLCTERCQFSAIDSVVKGGRDIPVIDPARCFGCGLCRQTCPVEALALVPRHS
ncbi:MAG: 4Fe-4S dicluster domain-containing protein [Nitrospirae bacterium]|nr:MAG: 4Fe-4S dicluster domain-containing protein [Nitrospirota bacterium]